MFPSASSLHYQVSNNATATQPPQKIGIWFPNAHAGPAENWRPSGGQIQITVTFNQTDEDNSTGLALKLQPFRVDSWRPMEGSSKAGISSGPPLSSPQSQPVTTPSHKPFPPEEMAYSLDPKDHPSNEDLLRWIQAEKSPTGDDEKTLPSFDVAIERFVFALDNSSLLLPPPPQDKSASESARGKRKGFGHIISSRRLVRQVCEMACWVKLWRTRALFVKGRRPPGQLGDGTRARIQMPSQLPQNVLSELNNLKLGSLVLSQQRVLEDLDDFLVTGVRGLELPVWACLWQMILTYRQLILAYTQALFHMELGSRAGESLHGNDAESYLHTYGPTCSRPLTPALWSHRNSWTHDLSYRANCRPT